MFGKFKKKEEPTEAAADVFEGLRRGTDVPPTAAFERFVKPAAIAADPSLAFSASNPEGKIFLGLTGASIKDDPFPHASGGRLIGVDDDRHWVLIAGNRAGKGRSVILPNLITYPGSIVVIDPKGDLASETARYRAEVLGQRVHVLDPFGAANESADPYRSSFNPLQHLDLSDEDALIDQASLIADALIKESKGESAHWDLTGKQFVEGVVLHVMTHDNYAGFRNLETVHSLLSLGVESNGPDQQSRLQAEMLSSNAAGGAVARSACAFYEKSERERGGVLSTIRRHLHVLGYPGIRSVLKDGSLELSSLSDTPTTVYLSLPAMKMGTCSGWLRMFINLTLGSFERNAERRKFQHQTSGHRVLLCLDEFNILGRLTSISNAAGQIAGLGCKLFPILQDLGQLKAHYPEEWETFLGNAGCIQFFGNMDLTTLKWVEERLGSTLIYTPSQNAPSLRSTVQEGASGSSHSIATHPLISVPEIARTFGRNDRCFRQLVLLAGRDPMILQRAYYDQHESFANKLHPSSPTAKKAKHR